MMPAQQSLNNSDCRSNSIVQFFHEEERSHLNKNTKGEDKAGHSSVQKVNKLNSLKQHFKSIPSDLLAYDKLIVIRDRKAVCQFEFRSKRAEIVIGTHPLANIVLDAPKVSKFHTRIICRNGVYYLQDLDSAYGTFLNGKKIPSNFSIVLQN